MKIKTKLTYGIGILFILILILGVVAGKYITDMSTDTRNILADNYQSLSYARQMLYSLENIGKDTAAVNVFIDNLRKQQNNITEKDEAEVYGKCAVTGIPMDSHDIHCHHKVPVSNGGRRASSP